MNQVASYRQLSVWNKAMDLAIFCYQLTNGSLMELETHDLLGQRLSFVSEATAMEFLERSAEIGRMLNGLIRSLREKQAGPSSPS